MGIHYAASSSTTTSGGAGIGVLIVMGIALGIAWYFVPLIISLIRMHNPLGVGLVNLFVGWTLIGWIAALVMACTSKPQPQAVTVMAPPYPMPPYPAPPQHAALAHPATEPTSPR